MTVRPKRHAATMRRLARIAGDREALETALLDHWASPTSHFDRLSQRSDPARIEPLDLVAVTALGPTLSVEQAGWILGDEGQWLTTEILADVPSDLSLHAADVCTVHRVADLFHLLRTQGLTRSATTRLLAAKRPQLVPIDDATTRRALRYAKSDLWWSPWRNVMDDELTERVRSARDKAAAQVPDLSAFAPMRVLDIGVRSS